MYVMFKTAQIPDNFPDTKLFKILFYPILIFRVNTYPYNGW